MANNTLACCVSLSTFYNSKITACPVCSCGCQASGNKRPPCVGYVYLFLPLVHRLICRSRYHCCDELTWSLQAKNEELVRTLYPLSMRHCSLEKLANKFSKAEIHGSPSLEIIALTLIPVSWCTSYSICGAETARWNDCQEIITWWAALITCVRFGFIGMWNLIIEIIGKWRWRCRTTTFLTISLTGTW